MSKSVKATLFSAFLFPGAGHFLLKSYFRGVLLLLPFLTASIYIFNSAMEKASAIKDKVLSGEVPLDPDAILALVRASSANSDTFQSNIATYTLVICWVASIVDSYLIGKRQEISDKKDGLSKR